MKQDTKEQKAVISAIFKQKKGNKSYYRISKDSGLTISQLHLIEQGKDYTINSLLKLCRALDCKLEIK